MSDCLVKLNGAYTIRHIYSNIRNYGEMDDKIDLFVINHIINKTTPTNNHLINDGFIALKGITQGYKLDEPSLSDRIKLSEAKRHVLNNAARIFGVKSYTSLNF